MESRAGTRRRGRKAAVAINWSFGILHKLMARGVGVDRAVPSSSLLCRQPGWEVGGEARVLPCARTVASSERK